jgi:hypothetical protein
MSVGSMRKLTIEVDPSLREILERRLLESADMDYVSVRSVPSSRGLLAGGWQRGRARG